MLAADSHLYFSELLLVKTLLLLLKVTPLCLFLFACLALCRCFVFHAEYRTLLELQLFYVMI